MCLVLFSPTYTAKCPFGTSTGRPISSFSHDPTLFPFLPKLEHRFRICFSTAVCGSLFAFLVMAMPMYYNYNYQRGLFFWRWESGWRENERWWWRERGERGGIYEEMGRTYHGCLGVSALESERHGGVESPLATLFSVGPPNDNMGPHYSLSLSTPSSFTFSLLLLSQRGKSIA